MKSRNKLLLAIVIVIIAGCAGLDWLMTEVQKRPMEAYAVWWTADLVISHMEKHQGRWPTNWQELEATAEQVYKGVASTNKDGSVIFEMRPRADIQELQKTVEIDWHAKPSDLVQQPSPPSKPAFRVIRLKSGRSTHFEGAEPNQMIRDYLKLKHPDESKLMHLFSK